MNETGRSQAATDGDQMPVEAETLVITTGSGNLTEYWSAVMHVANNCFEVAAESARSDDWTEGPCQPMTNGCTGAPHRPDCPSQNASSPVPRSEPGDGHG